MKLRSKFQILVFLLVTLLSGYVLATPFHDYLVELDGVSVTHTSDNTKRRLIHHYNNEKRILDEADLARKHHEFNAHKEEYIAEWEKYTGNPWPKYTYPTRNRRYGDRFDAHHIIPQSYDGPNAWWNLIPLTNHQHHQIHSDGSSCSTLFPSSRGHGRENEGYL